MTPGLQKAKKMSQPLQLENIQLDLRLDRLLRKLIQLKPDLGRFRIKNFRNFYPDLFSIESSNKKNADKL